MSAKAAGLREELFVAVPPQSWEPPAGTGAGRVWRAVLSRLTERVRVEPVDPGRRRLRGRLRRRPDVWLLSGHDGPIDRPEPIVVVVHGAAWFLERDAIEMTPPWARPWVDGLVALTERTLPCASFAIVPSNYTRRGLLAGSSLSPDQVVAVPHGVDVSVFRPGCPGGRKLVAEHLGGDRSYVLFASIPTIPQKNLPALRDAMGHLAADGHPHALVIAGGLTGVEPPEVAAAVGADLPGGAGRVAWLGQVGDDVLAALMASADAFCLPSLIESFGLTCLEALAAGAPVVVSDRGALPEVVADAALLAEPTAEGIHRALTAILGDPTLAARLRRAGPARAAGMTWDRTAAGWLRVLRRAAAA